MFSSLPLDVNILSVLTATQDGPPTSENSALLKFKRGDPLLVIGEFDDCSCVLCFTKGNVGIVRIDSKAKDEHGHPGETFVCRQSNAEQLITACEVPCRMDAHVLVLLRLPHWSFGCCDGTFGLIPQSCISEDHVSQLRAIEAHLPCLNDSQIKLLQNSIAYFTNVLKEQQEMRLVRRVQAMVRKNAIQAQVMFLKSSIGVAGMTERTLLVQQFQKEEFEYRQKLTHLFQHYRQPMLQYYPDLSMRIFGNLEAICELHNELHINLEEAMEEFPIHSLLGHLFYRFSNRFRLYVEYCESVLPDPERNLRNLSETDPKFCQFLEERQSHILDLRLSDLLILPLQRIAQVAKLLRRLLDIGDPTDMYLRYAHQYVAAANNQIRHAQVERLNRAILFEIQMEITAPNQFDLVRPRRAFIARQQFSNSRELLLFDDVLLLAVPGREEGTIAIQREIELDTLVPMYNDETQEFWLDTQDPHVTQKMLEQISKLGEKNRHMKKIADQLAVKPKTDSEKLRLSASIRGLLKRVKGDRVHSLVLEVLKRQTAPLGFSVQCPNADIYNEWKTMLIEEEVMEKKGIVEFCQTADQFYTGCEDVPDCLLGTSNYHDLMEAWSQSRLLTTCRRILPQLSDERLQLVKRVLSECLKSPSRIPIVAPVLLKSPEHSPEAFIHSVLLELLVEEILAVSPDVFPDLDMTEAHQFPLLPFLKENTMQITVSKSFKKIACVGEMLSPLLASPYYEDFFGFRCLYYIAKDKNSICISRNKELLEFSREGIKISPADEILLEDYHGVAPSRISSFSKRLLVLDLMQPWFVRQFHVSVFGKQSEAFIQMMDSIATPVQLDEDYQKSKDDEKLFNSSQYRTHYQGNEFIFHLCNPQAEGDHLMHINYSAIYFVEEQEQPFHLNPDSLVPQVVAVCSPLGASMQLEFFRRTVVNSGSHWSAPDSGASFRDVLLTNIANLHRDVLSRGPVAKFYQTPRLKSIQALCRQYR